MRLLFLTFKWTMLMACPLQKILKERNSKVAIFFITSFGRYQDDAMDLNAFRFFEKPFDPDRLCSGLDKVMEYIDRTYVDFFVYTNGIHKKITRPTTSCMLKGITAGAYCIRSMRHILLVNHLTSGKRRSKAHIFIQSTNRL